MGKNGKEDKATVTHTRGYRYRLYPDQTQTDALLASGYNARALWKPTTASPQTKL